MSSPFHFFSFTPIFLVISRAFSHSKWRAYWGRQWRQRVHNRFKLKSPYELKDYRPYSFISNLLYLFFSKPFNVCECERLNKRFYLVVTFRFNLLFLPGRFQYSCAERRPLLSNVNRNYHYNETCTMMRKNDHINTMLFGHYIRTIMSYIAIIVIIHGSIKLNELNVNNTLFEGYKSWKVNITRNYTQ